MSKARSQPSIFYHQTAAGLIRLPAHLVRTRLSWQAKLNTPQTKDAFAFEHTCCEHTFDSTIYLVQWYIEETLSKQRTTISRVEMAAPNV